MRLLAFVLVLVVGVLHGPVGAVTVRGNLPDTVTMADFLDQGAKLLEKGMELAAATTKLADKKADLRALKVLYDAAVVARDAATAGQDAALAVRDAAVAMYDSEVAAHAALALKVTTGVKVVVAATVVAGGVVAHQAYYFVPTADFQEVREQASALTWGQTLTTGTGLTLTAYLSHKGYGSPLPSLAAIRELRTEFLTSLLEEELLELSIIDIGLRRARPLALPAPPVLCLPTPQDAARALVLLSPSASAATDTPRSLLLFLLAYAVFAVWTLCARRTRLSLPVPAPATAHAPLAPAPTVATLMQAVLAATAAWHDAIRAKQADPAVEGMNKAERGKVRAAARLAVSKTRGDARDAWAALIERVGPISSYLGEEARVLLPLRLAFVSTCLAFMNNAESVIGRVDDQREVARAWVMALLGERPELLHAYTTSDEHDGVVCDKCGCPGEHCACGLLQGAKTCIPDAFTTLVDTAA